MWQRFTEKARQIVFRAQEQAGQHETSYVTPEHLLLGLTLVEDNMGRRILDALGLSPLELFEEIGAQLPSGEGTTGQDLMLTPRSKKVIDLAFEQAKELKHDYIGGEHLLLGILREGESMAAVTLAGHGITVERVKVQLQQLRDSDVPKPDEELLNLDEAVKFLGTSKPTLYRVLRQGELRGLKVGRQWRFRKADLVAYMERSPVAVAAAPSGEMDTELEGFMKMTVEAGAGTAIAGMKMRDMIGTGEEKTTALADLIVSYAVTLRASDIHLEPIRQEGVTSLLLRYRVDGLLHEIRRLPMSVSEALMMRFKYMADMSLNEKRMPQQGRIPVRYQEKDFDLRAAFGPSVLGETLVIRILDKSRVLLGLDKLGLTQEDLERIRELLRQPSGLFIATGPIGSGKTTLLYSALADVADIEKKVLTVEDPVEVQLPHTTQMQVNRQTGLTFPAALRSFLRQDPDVIFVGELRDEETARVITEASLTGHLVLSTLYANDAPAALARLLDLGLEPYLISATVIGVVAQRLCRRICDDCKQSYQAPARDLTRFGLEPDDLDQTITLYRGDGCEKCRFKGYRGRTGLFELLIMNEEIANLVVSRAPQAEVAAAARAAGMNSLWQDGLLKVLDGVTAPDEVMRVCSL